LFGLPSTLAAVFFRCFGSTSLELNIHAQLRSKIHYSRNSSLLDFICWTGAACSPVLQKKFRLCLRPEVLVTQRKLTMANAVKRKADDEPAGPARKTAKVASKVHPSRIRKLNANSVTDGPVIYW
jgi:hypothetical protein